jgi:hypothetical protein
MHCGTIRVQAVNGVANVVDSFPEWKIKEASVFTSGLFFLEPFLPIPNF